MRRVPRWTPDPTRFPRAALLEGPSPLQRLPRFAAALGGRAEIWIKREDLLPLAFGGNKLRNLEFLVGAAIAEGADVLVTSGRRWSNHARLTAAAGARTGLAVHLVLSGPPTDPPNPGLRLDAMLGATIHQTATDRREEREAAVARVVADLRAAGRTPYTIGVGGSGMPGVVSQVLAALELVDGAAAAGFVPDAVVVPSATAGTQAGLLAGFATAQLSTRVHGIATAHEAAERRARIRALLDELAALPGIAPVTDDRILLDDSQVGLDYGVPTTTGADAASLLARTEGALDDRTVVFWHAGGTPGLFEPLPTG
jgi:L-cysteate sulfo-lyase